MKLQREISHTVKAARKHDAGCSTLYYVVFQLAIEEALSCLSVLYYAL